MGSKGGAAVKGTGYNARPWSHRVFREHRKESAAWQGEDFTEEDLEPCMRVYPARQRGRASDVDSPLEEGPGLLV